MLLTSLHPKSPDLADAVRIGEDSWGRGDLVGAATAAAERIGGASGPIAVLARPSIDTVLAVVAGLIAGVPIVPVPADVGIAERRHILADSAAVAWLGESPDESEGLPHVPVRRHARSWHQ
ncbi:acyl-CoA synthetase, partial [Mycobacteroides abscessus]